MRSYSNVSASHAAKYITMTCLHWPNADIIILQVPGVPLVLHAGQGYIEYPLMALIQSLMLPQRAVPWSHRKIVQALGKVLVPR